MRPEQREALYEIDMPLPTLPFRGQNKPDVSHASVCHFID